MEAPAIIILVLTGPRIPVPNGNACWYLKGTKCSDCEKFYDGRMNNDDDGKCVWMPHIKNCWAKKHANNGIKKKSFKEYTEICTGY